jgi:pimeloyl-ACP methyl ester carboxylesterase
VVATIRIMGTHHAGPTFVLVHGSGSSSFMWVPVQRELALLGHRSFTVDLPGHGIDAQYPGAYQAPQDLDAWAIEPSTLAKVTRLSADRTLPVAMQDQLIAEADALTPGNPYDVHTMERVIRVTSCVRRRRWEF